MDAQIALENLILTRDVLAMLKIRYFLIDGTLLGLTRNGRFIEWDHDIDLGVFAEDFTFRSFGLCAALMQQNGFSYHVRGRWKRNLTVRWWRKGVQIDFFFYFRRQDQRVCRLFDTEEITEFTFPAALIEQLESADFYGSEFTVPKQKEAVLTHIYGDWATPKTDWNGKTSPFHITRRIRTTKAKLLESYVSRKLLGLSERFRR